MEAMMSEQRGFFDLDARYAALSAAADPLEKLGGLIDFEIFRSALDGALKRSDGSKGGRPPMDAVMMFKVLVLQTLYGLSDAQAEFQIRSQKNERKIARRTRIEGPLPQGAGQTASAAASKGQYRPLQNPLCRRACLCHPEAPDVPVHPHHRDRASQDKNRPREHRLQFQTLPVLGTEMAMT
jgi:hypothetical protein